MANENELKVIFGADGKPLEKTLQELEADLKDFQKQLNNVSGGTAIADLNKRLQETKSSLANIKKFGLDQELNKIKPSAANAAAGLTDVSRVIQDLPYGFVGVQNNINPLIESFGRLKAETGSGKLALKALATSLTGPGGLGIAIAGISTAFLLYQKFSRSATQETKKHNDELKGLISNIAQEASRVSILVGAIQNETTSRKQRNQAIEELKKLNPNYFGQLKDEKGLIEGLTGAYNSYVQGLVRAAQSKAYEAKLQKAFERKIEIELAIDPDNPENILKAARSVGQSAADEMRRAYNIKPLSDSVKTDLTKNAALWDQSGNFIGKKIREGVGRANILFDKKAVNSQLNGITNEIEFFVKKIQSLGQVGFKPIAETKAPKGADLKSLTILFDEMNQQSGKMWQQLIEESEKDYDKYINGLLKSFADQSKLRKIHDKLNGVNEQIRLGLSGLAQPGPATQPQDPTLPLLEKRYAILQKLKALGQTPIDVSYLSDIGAQNLLLNEQLGTTIAKLQSIGPIVQEFLAPAFSQFFQSVLSGTETVGQALKSFFKNLIVQIISTIAQAAALAAIMSAITGGGFGAMFKGFLGGGGPNLAGLVTGGQSMDINVSGMLRGSDIFLSGSRGAASLGRRGPI